MTEAERCARQLRGYTIDVTIGGELKMRLTTTVDGGRLSAIYIGGGRIGSTVHGLLHEIGERATAELRAGVPLATLIQAWRFVSFAPAGFSDDPEVGWVTSPLDYIAQRLALDYL